MAPRSNLDTTWLPIIMQKAKKIGKPYTDGELKTIAGEFLKRLPQNVDNNSFNEILNQTFVDFDNMKANPGAKPQWSQEPQTPKQQPEEDNLEADKPAEHTQESQPEQQDAFVADETNPEEEPKEPKEAKEANDSEVQQRVEPKEGQRTGNIRDPLTGLTVANICKVGDNLEKIIRNSLKERYGYLLNLDYKIVRDPGTRLSLNYNETVKEFKESWADSGYGDGFTDTEVEKIIKSNILVIYVLKEQVLSDIVSVIRENPAFKANSGLVVSSASIPNMADVPYMSMNIRFSQRDYNGKIVANVGVTVYGGKFRPLMKSGLGFLSNIFKMTTDLANRR